MLVAKAIQMSLTDSTIMAVLLNKLLPSLRAEGIAAPIALDLKLPPGGQAQQVIDLMAAGRLPIDDGNSLLAAIERRVAIEHSGELEALVVRLADANRIAVPATLRIRSAAKTEQPGALQ